MRVLVAEDDAGLRSVLERGLQENGYVVDTVADGTAALRHLRTYDYDVAVLDWRMPEHTGIEVVAEARRLGDRTPILMLTARDAATDRVAGLNGGADDYLVKPFDFSELIARIHALQRRPPLALGPVLECGDLRFDPATRKVTVAGETAALDVDRDRVGRTSAPPLSGRSDAAHDRDPDLGRRSRWRRVQHDRRSRRPRARQAGAQPSAHRDGTGHGISDSRGVKTNRAHRRNAVRVAAVATLIVILGYVLAAVVLNLIVNNHLVNTADSRLSERLKDVHNQTLNLPGPSAHAEHPDVDDAPLFLWSIAPSGAVTPLTPTTPTLPVRHWGSAPITLDVGTSTFRFDTLQRGGTVLVAGQSMAGASNVQATLLVAELVFGVILAVATFAGATIVGLRASAPSELVRRRQAEFTADASHELRTPISVIEAEVELALDRPREPAAYRDVLERVGLESARLRRIVDDLLWLARADNRTVHAEEADITDVADTVDTCVQRFGALAATHRVALSAQRVGAGPFTVQADAELIDRLAGVLVDNACKFAGEGGRVEVTVRSTGGRVDLRVDDSGPGIPTDQRDAVFDRFHRATDSVAGTGLGLAIADAVVRSTHGSWEIAVSELGGARLEVSWRKALGRKSKPSPAGKNLTESLA